MTYSEDFTEREREFVKPVVVFAEIMLIYSRPEAS